MSDLLSRIDGMAVAAVAFLAIIILVSIGLGLWVRAQIRADAQRHDES
jgi:hypothetical protein